MKISILLPYKENFSSKYAGAVSLFTRDTTLRSKYKNNITIVIQYEFWNLKVQKNEFSIDLSFNNTIANLTVPFDSIISFADPYANFGLQIAKDNSVKKEKKEKSKIHKNKIINLDKYRKN